MLEGPMAQSSLHYHRHMSSLKKKNMNLGSQAGKLMRFKSTLAACEHANEERKKKKGLGLHC